MNYLTAYDKDFVHCFNGLAESCEKYNGKQIIGYDLDDHDHKDWKKMVEFDKGKAIATTHKPALIRHYFDNFEEPVLYVDADCLFRAKVDEADFKDCDMAVTMREWEDIDRNDLFTGLINAGVMYFKEWTEALDDWWERCEKPNTTDQKAMNEVLGFKRMSWVGEETITLQYEDSEVKARILPCSIYNDYTLTNGKIFHLKSGNHRDWKYKELIEKMGGI